MPGADPTNGGKFDVPNAELKALGLIAPGASGTDGYVGLNSALPWSYNPGGTATAGSFDPVGTLEHEITEVLGRVGFLGAGGTNVYGPMDLFRYSAAGQRDLTAGPGYFSVDGRTMLQSFNNPLKGGDAADWSPAVQGDTFGDAVQGTSDTLSSTDLQVLDVLGYTLSTSPVPAPAHASASSSSLGATLARPEVSIDQGVMFHSASDALLTGTVSNPAASVDVYDGTVFLGAATVNGDGSWALDAAFAPGEHGQISATARVGGVTGTSSASFTLQTGIVGAPYSALEQDFDSSGNLVGEIYDKPSGSAYLEDTVQNPADGSHVISYTSGSYFANKAFYAKQDYFSADYTPVKEVLYNNNGTHSIVGEQNGLTLSSIHNDVMTGGGTQERFVFKAHPGHETITDFQASGPNHDVISLSSSQFANIAAILSSTHTVGNNAVITIAPHDTITVENVTATTLRAHRNDLSLHA